MNDRNKVPQFITPVVGEDSGKIFVVEHSSLCVTSHRKEEVMGAVKAAMMEEADNEFRALHAIYGDCILCGDEVDVDHEGVEATMSSSLPFSSMSAKDTENFKRDNKENLRALFGDKPVTGTYTCSGCQHTADKDD